MRFTYRHFRLDLCDRIIRAALWRRRDDLATAPLGTHAVSRALPSLHSSDMVLPVELCFGRIACSWRQLRQFHLRREPIGDKTDHSGSSVVH